MAEHVGTPNSSPVRIRSVAAGGLRLRHWPPQCLVFNPASGSTHLLSEEAGDMLAYIDGQVSTDRLALLHSFWADPDATESASTLDALLAQFEALGLVELATQ